MQEYEPIKTARAMLQANQAMHAIRADRGRLHGKVRADSAARWAER
jgi:hypothetical protein